jgi:peptide chain release factor 1
MQFVPKLDQLEERFEALTQQMADPAVIGDADLYRKVAKAHSELSEVVSAYREWKKNEDALSQARPMLADGDPDLRAMAQEEITSLEPELARLEEHLKVLLLPRRHGRR